MFDAIPTMSPGFRVVSRAIFSVAGGALLTFGVPSLLILADTLLWPSHSFLTNPILRVLKPPASLYCTIFEPSGFQEGDGIRCLAIGLLFLVVPVLSVIIFLVLTWRYRRRENKLQTE